MTTDQLDRLPPIRVLALDLEGTLVSNAMSQIPRAGLNTFVVECAKLADRLVIYTAISEPRFRQVAHTLVADHFAPPWFKFLEYIHWSGPYKDLAFIPHADPSAVILVDDNPGYIKPGQEAQWIQAREFAPPYEPDAELDRILAKLRDRVGPR